MNMRKAETIQDKIWRYRGVALVAIVPIVLVAFIFLLVPRKSPLYEHPHTIEELRRHQHTQHEPLTGTRYAVVLDAGSTGSRVHIFKFDQTDRDLKLISDTFEQLKPGLSSFAADPKQAAASLKPLLDLALKTVPLALQAKTPISLKATAGLRLLPTEQSNGILNAVTSALNGLPFVKRNDSVTILEGQQEGAFAWLTLNYLLGTVGGDVKTTVAAIDLGGGSVQEAFALSDEAAASAPAGYVVKLRCSGKTYNVYVHSYLGHGLMASRAKLIDSVSSAGSACFPANYSGEYSYGGKPHVIAKRAAPGKLDACGQNVHKVLEPEKSCGKPATECSFNGVWRGPGPEAGRQYYLSSYLWDRAVESGIVSDKTAIQWSASPKELAVKAEKVCSMSVQQVIAEYKVPESQAPFFCFDLTYSHRLLTRGFRLMETARAIFVKQLKYNGQNIEAAWALGAAINDLASS